MIANLGVCIQRKCIIEHLCAFAPGRYVPYIANRLRPVVVCGECVFSWFYHNINELHWASYNALALELRYSSLGFLGRGEYSARSTSLLPWESVMG